ncbi:hypothetical protein NDU88_004378 [Pleurodeles waltl]|uniref:Uncharacterized protein n=1 Tax=Pleurodeles waltl TaxID=8319 RepID=A0AAV7W4T6_PLEWA|nr:hypothetical protein NDU88_004378 [Pleurodeles waltl]
MDTTWQPPITYEPESPASSTPTAIMDCILKEIAVVRPLEGMVSNIAALTAGTKSIHMDITGFQHHVTGLEQHVVTVEDCLNTVSEQDQELLLLCSKDIDLEDRNCRDNIRIFSLPECLEGTNVRGFLRNTLPTLTGLVFDTPL